MTALFLTLDAILYFYTWIIILSAVFSWLYAFNVINSSNQFVNQVGNMLYQLTEPALRPIRKILPMFGAIDLSPLALLFFIMFLRYLIRFTIAPMFGVYFPN